MASSILNVRRREHEETGYIGSICLLPLSAHADGWGVSGKIGTLGVGLDLNGAVNESVTGRLGLNQYSYSATAVQSTVSYNLGFKWQTVEALADWYPSRGTFRTTLGLMYNNNKIDMTGMLTGGTFIINGIPYSASQVGSLNGQVSFNTIAPYLGIGWGNPVAKGKGWGFVADVGILFQGSPKVTLNATCGAALSAAQCSVLQSNTQAEAGKAQSSLSSYQYYPVASIGASYQF